MTEKESRVAALQAGEVQVAADVFPDDVPGLKSRGFEFAAGPTAESWVLNMKPMPDSPLNDVRVRKAINHAIGRDALVKDLFGGLTRRLDSLVGPGIFGHNPNIKDYADDPAFARSLLRGAGGDGAQFLTPASYYGGMGLPNGRFYRPMLVLALDGQTSVPA